jgi:hypothetical protein
MFSSMYFYNYVEKQKYNINKVTNNQRYPFTKEHCHLTILNRMHNSYCSTNLIYNPKLDKLWKGVGFSVESGLFETTYHLQWQWNWMRKKFSGIHFFPILPISMCYATTTLQQTNTITSFANIVMLTRMIPKAWFAYHSIINWFE